MTLRDSVVAEDRINSTHVKRPIICLAASGGGHLRQILDLKPFWQDHSHFFVTEDTALGQSVGGDARTYYVPHFALGQARLGNPLKMLGRAMQSLWQSARIVLATRPDIVLTTGAGSQLFIVLWARMLGARIILVDSFARFVSPSAFAKLAGPLAHVRIAQSAESARHWPGSIVFDPFKRIEGVGQAKDALLFATVGATLPFPRLVDYVATALAAGGIPEAVVLQTGTDGPCPTGATCHASMPFDAIGRALERAAIVVCHGGTGSLITALRAGCNIIAVPRRYDLGEHYDDHQSEITTAFARLGLIDVANTQEEFAAALVRARSRTPVRATTDPAALIDYLQNYAANWAADRRPGDQ